MKKSELWEGLIILLSAVLLLPIWMASSGWAFSPMLLEVLGVLQYPIIIVLGVIFARRLRRIIRAMRDNKNRPGPF